MLAILLLNISRLYGDVQFGGRQFPHNPLPDVSQLPTHAEVKKKKKQQQKKKKKKQYNLRFVPLSELEEVVERTKGYDIPQMKDKVEELTELFTPEGVSTIEDLFDKIEDNNEKFKDVLSSKPLIERVQYLEEWMDEEDLIAVLIQDD